MPALTPVFGSDGSVRFAEFVVDQFEPPSEKIAPDRLDPSLLRRELGYRFLLLAPGSRLPVSCVVSGRRGSLFSGPETCHISCRAGGYILSISGRGSTDFVAAQHVSGWTEPPGPDGRSALVPGDGFTITGAPSLWNLALRSTRPERSVAGDGTVLAAVALEPARVHLDPRLEGPLRLQAALSIAALLVLREVGSLTPPME